MDRLILLSDSIIACKWAVSNSPQMWIMRWEKFGSPGVLQRVIRPTALYPHLFTLCFTMDKAPTVCSVSPSSGDSLICNTTYSKSLISRSHYHIILLDIAMSTKLAKWNTSRLTEWNNCWIHNNFFCYDIPLYYHIKQVNFFFKEKRQLKCGKH
jgi:hypothetical protein